MKFRVPSKALYNAAAAVLKVINSKNPLQILNNFLVTVDPEKSMLSLMGSDTENTLVGRVSVAEAEGAGCFCIDAKRMVDLLREMPETSMEFAVNDENLSIAITYDGGEYQMMGLDGSQFPMPKADDAEEAQTIECPAQQLVDGVEKTIFAVGTDDFRPQMMGIFFDIHPTEIIFVATDTRKLVRYSNSMSQPGITAHFIMPAKPAGIMRNVFAKQETIKLTITSKRATLESPDFTMTCPFIKGAFPPYDKVIPMNNPYTLTVDRGVLASAVRRTAIFVESGTSLLKMRITSTSIELKAVDATIGYKAREVVPCGYDGQDLIIGFSANFLLEILNTLTTDDVIVKLADSGRAGVFAPSENAKDTSMVMVLMPMAVVDF